jgi:hypothetical protein
MSRLRACFVSLAVLLIAAAAVPAHAQQKLPDGTLYTLYSNVMSSQVNWVTCGSLPQSSGCYGSGHLGTFTNACAVVQSVPAALNLNTVVRYIYVLDSGSGASGMSLFAFKRTDTVSQSQDTINITQVASVPLPALVGGLGVSCTLAQNPTYVFAGTNQSTTAVGINKSSYAVGNAGLFTGSVTAITADSYGYVIIDQNQNGSHGNTVYGPDGALQSDGGGAYYMINPINGVNPANYPFTLESDLPAVGWRAK